MTRKILANCLCAVLALLMFTNAAFAARPRVSVFDFGGNAEWELLSQATYHLTRKLVELDRFDLVERADIDRILSEQRFQLSGIVDENTAVQVGKILGINVAFLGHIDEAKSSLVRGSESSYYSANARVSVKIVDVESGKLLHMITTTGAGTNKKRDAAMSTALLNCFDEDMQVQLRRVFSLNSGVTQVAGNQVYLLLGNKAGVKTGARFNILRKEASALGIELGDEDTYTRKIGLVEVTATTANTARAKIIWESERIAPGDLAHEEARPNNQSVLLALQTVNYAVEDQYGDKSQGSSAGILLRLGQERPYSYDLGGEAGLSSAAGNVALFHLGGYVEAEIPVVSGFTYLTLQGSAGANVGMQDYDDVNRWGVPKAGDAISSNFYLGAGTALKVYLTRDKGVRFEAGATGRLGPALAKWKVADDDYNFDVTDYVKYPTVCVSSISLHIGLSAAF